LRQWLIQDQVLPVPFPLSDRDLNERTWIPIADSFSEEFGRIRRFADFRAYHDSGIYKPDEMTRDSRLVGRSVWNTQWLLIIPAAALHSDREEALKCLIEGKLLNPQDKSGPRDGNGISDILLFFETYAYAGN